jgi:hypothetical protein
MGSAVKKIAKVAAFAAISFYGGQALSGYLSGGTALGGGFTSSLGTVGGAIHTGAKIAAPGVGTSLFGATALQRAGIGLQAVSYMQQRKTIAAQQSAMKKQANEQKRIAEMQRRYREAMEQRQRYNITEQTRGRVGMMEAGAARGGLSLGPGTSSFAGATGAIQSSATANLENINLASGASTAISEGNQRAADYATKANVAYGEQQSWSSLSSLGGNMFKYSDKYADAGNALFSIFKT